MHLPESEVVRALPYRGFLREYTEYAARCTDAPLAYHVGVGLSLLTQTCPVGLKIPMARDVYSNLFVLLVGDSGEARKGVAMSIGVDMLRELGDKIVGEEPASEEGLVESLRENNRQLVHYDEFGNFLAASMSGPMQKIKTKLNALYDNAPQGRALAKSRKGVIAHPRLSMLGGCAPEFLERHTESTDWTGGFFSRFLILAATRERYYPLSGSDSTLRSVLTARLRDMASHPIFGPCLGLNAEARAIFARFETDINAAKIDPVFRSVLVRAPAFALKIALLLSWDYGPARSGAPWHVTADTMQPAVAIAGMHALSMTQLATRIDVNKDMRDRRIVLASVDATPTPIGEITRRSRMLKDRHLATILATLVEERLVEVVWSNGVECYRKRGPGEMIPVIDGSPAALAASQAVQAAPPAAFVAPVAVATSAEPTSFGPPPPVQPSHWVPPIAVVQAGGAAVSNVVPIESARSVRSALEHRIALDLDGADDDE